MKRSSKVLLWLGFSLLIFGVFVALIAAVFMDFDSDFRALNTSDLTLAKHEVEGNFENLKIETSFPDVRVIPSESDKVIVTYPEGKNFTYEISIVDNELCILEKDERKWTQKFGINFLTDDSVTVELPLAEYKSAAISSQSGNIRVPSGFSFYIVALSSQSGNIEWQSDVKGSFASSAQSGRIALSGTFGSTAAASQSGNIVLADVSCGALGLVSQSGTVKLENVSVREALTVSTSSGSVKIEESDAGSIEIETMSGSVHCSFLTPKTYVTKTSSGSVSVPETTGGECRITTSSGSITCK